MIEILGFFNLIDAKNLNNKNMLIDLQKQGHQVVDVNVAGARKEAAAAAEQRRVQEKKKTEVVVVADTKPKTPSGHGKVEQKLASKKKKTPTFTSFLTARSKV